MNIGNLINDLKMKKITLYYDNGNIKIIGPKSEITNELKAILKENKQKIINYLTKNNISKAKESEDECYPLSSAQKRMYVLNNIDKESISYNVPFIMKITGELDIERFEKCFENLIKRHEGLRTSFIVKNGEVFQKVNQSVEFKIKYQDIYEDSIEDKIKEFIRPFNLEEAPLMRAEICKVEKNQHYMMIDMHHIITDGLSMNIFINELSKLYSGDSLEEMKFQYKDYSCWQEELNNSDKLINEEKYWLDIFKEPIPLLDLPTDFIRPKLQSYEGSTMKFNIDNKLTEQLKFIAKENEVTLYMVLLAIYTVFLSRYTNQEDIVVGSPVEGRTNDDLKNIIGMFVNTLPLRVKPKKKLTFEEYLKQIKINTLGAYKNQNYQFDKLVEKLDIEKDVSRGTLFDTMFDLQNSQDIQFKIEGLTFESYDIKGDTAKFDLSLTAFEYEDIIIFEFEYCTRLFTKDTIRNIGNKFISVLEQICNDITLKLEDINMLSKEEEDTILHKFNRDYVENKYIGSLSEVFEYSVEKTPDKIAVIYEDESLTYDQLNKKANKLARLLRQKGIKENDIVGIMVERSLDMMIGILAILKAGAAYMPIDPDYPEERIQYMIKDSKAPLIIIQEKLKGKVNKYNFISFNQQEVQDFDDSNLECVNKLDDLAYIIYTSGTTGNPKGVMIRHSNVLNYIESFLEQVDLTEDDTILQVVSFAFDAFTEEIYPIFSKGGKIVISGKLQDIGVNGLIESINKYTITFMSCSPLLLNEIDKNKNLNHSRKMKFVSGGDILKYDYIKNIIKFSDVYNSYGPTEATVCATYYKVNINDESKISIPIGKALSNYKVVILDEESNLVPIGRTGELCIGGKGLSLGYLNNPELTKQKFTIHEKLGKIYHTGDLAKYLPDGNIEFVGRNDNQVKIRGYRIELREIEHKLLSYEKINDAIVITREDERGEKYLYAYVSGEELDVNDIRKDLSKELPGYMMPAYIVVIDEIPHTINGKVDIKALPKPSVIDNGKEYFEAPENNTEKKLVDIWKEILNLNDVGVTSNFFEVGGHSLKAFALVSKIHEVLGVEVNLSQIFAAPTIREISKLIIGKEKRSYKEIEKAQEKEYYNVSPAQKRLYLLNTIEENNLAYNVPFAMKIKGNLDFNKLKMAYKKLIDKHESLRTSFVIIDGEPVQKIEKDVDLPIEYHDELKDDDINKEISGFIRSFELDKAPLSRVEVIKIGYQQYIMLMDIHHIICDGFSMDILIKDLVDFYNQKETEPLTIQYKDYSEWRRKFVESKIYKDQEKYWLNEFSGEVPMLNMPMDYMRGERQSFEGDIIYFKADSGLSSTLRDIAKKNGITMNMLLLTAYTTLLYKYSGQSDIVVGLPIIGRHHKDLNNVIGMFVNTLPLRNYPEGNKKFSSYLNEVKNTSIKAYENQEYDFYDLVEKLKIKRSRDRNPLFDTTFNMSDSEKTDFNVDGITFEQYPIEFNTSKFDFTLSAIDGDEEIGFILRYCKTLFNKDTMERMSSHFINILKQIASNLDIKLDEIEIISEYERNKLLNDFNNTIAEYPRDKTIIELFEEQVENVPDKIAVVYEGTELTYKELNERANSLARSLRKKGIGPDSIVAIMVNRSVQMIVGIMSILKAGGAYLPIDPKYPKNRIEYMLNNSGAKVVLTESEFIEEISCEVDIYDINNENLYSNEKHNLEKVSNENNLAYVIYTSGTTGNSKGVMIKNSSLVNYCSYIVKKTHIKLEDETALLSSYAFDLGHTVVFTSLISGITLRIVPEDKYRDPSSLIRYIEKNITYIKITPSLFSMIINCKDVMRIFDSSNLRLIILGGESINVKDIKRFKHMDKENKVQLMNHYGPTESTVGCISTMINTESLEESKNVIGKPINNTKIYIVDNKNKIMPIGVSGELCISGSGLARGYLNNEQLTREKFIDNPYEPGQKMYKTGDLARWLVDGNIEFLGRIDDQVKINGYRIETMEIESQLLKNPSIEEAIVIPKEDKNGNKYLCAYVVLKEANKNISIAEIREALLMKLPSYMIPFCFVKLNKLPITANGKINKKLLPEPDRNLEKEENYEPPRNEIEKQMIEVWEDILDVRGIGINTNFFEVGGDSIKALQIVSKLSKYNLKVEIKDIFSNTKIKNISKYVRIIKRKEKNNEIIEGNVELTPIQIRFFNNKEEVNHYNQSFILYRKSGFKEEIVEQVFNKIVEQHDALRMTFTEESGKIIQYNRPLGEKFFDLYVRDFRGKDNLEEKVYKAATEIQKKVRIFDGELIKLCIFKTDEGDHLLIVIHHLVVDGVSWRILFEDIQTLYEQISEGKKLDLGNKSTSYRDFSEELKEYSNSSVLLKEMSYWSTILRSKAKYISKNNVFEPGKYEDSRTLSITLNEYYTEKLLRQTNKTYNTQINDILLTALILTMREITGENKLKVSMEGHGREDVLKDIDISRTVGWFTATYPVYIDLEDDTEISNNIKVVKETLRKIPNKGIGYQILKYLSKEVSLENEEKPEILFNYLGEIDNAIDDGEISISKFETGESIGGKTVRHAPLDMNSIVVDGKLTISTTFNKNQYDDFAIDRMNMKYKENLIKIIQHCTGKEESEKTASDYGYGNLSLDELEDLLSDYE